MGVDKNEIARETNEMLVRQFVAAVGYDYRQDYSPHIYPDFSDDTVAMWEEVESRMTAPECLSFDREECLAQIRNEDRNQQIIIGTGANYTTSYHVGIRSGLNFALKAIEQNVRSNDEN